MRMRKKKHREERLVACGEYLYEHEGAPLSMPSEQIFGRAESTFCLEIGAGKGGFAVGVAQREENVTYLAMERVTDCVVLAVELAKARGVADRLRFINETADNLTDVLAPGSVDRIYLNFSDPWSKKGYAKRRLTHRRYLSVYLNLLKDGGVLQFKTDNVGLFDFSLEEISSLGLVPYVVERDLHSSEFAADNVVTEYEAAFSAQGVKINMLRLRKPVGFTVEVDPSLRSDRIRYNPHEGGADNG